MALPVPQGGSHEPIDLFAASSNGFFVESRVTGSVFDSKPSTDFQNGFFGDLEPDSKNTINESRSNPVGENDDFDDTFGEFETAFVDHSSVKKVNVAVFCTLSSSIPIVIIKEIGII